MCTGANTTGSSLLTAVKPMGHKTIVNEMCALIRTWTNLLVCAFYGLRTCQPNGFRGCCCSTGLPKLANLDVAQLLVQLNEQPFMNSPTVVSEWFSHGCHATLGTNKYYR